MQRILATSTVLLCLGASAHDNETPASNSVTDRLFGRRSEGWGPRGCYDPTGALVEHGSNVPGGEYCQVHVCHDGEWHSSTRNDPSCQRQRSRAGARRPIASAPTPRAGLAARGGVPSAQDGTLAKIVSDDVTRPNESIGCPLPTYLGGDVWLCPDQTLTLEQRRTLFDAMKPFDEINGVKLDDYWPATAGKTDPIANHYAFDYEGISFKGYKLSRPTGERAPIHYHEVAQQLCLEKGKIMVMTDGQEDRYYQAPDCYMMPAYTKVSVISIDEKVESCLLRVPHGGLDWVVIEPKYYDLQGQWTENLTGDKKQ